MQKRFDDRDAEEALRKRLEKDAQKQHGCEAKMLRDTAGHPEDGHADEQPGATETQVYGEDKGSVPSRGDLPEPDPWCRCYININISDHQ